ncbi:MAG: hypothetical protein EX271_11485 [Acidimicrobiales bacterium]|nr:hypothetical protein [Hyphomonadaceae bacterium]RZV37608.1 MAG: hypothetical protein EX271_11485 [Acidimicrobiales bacterium]
MKISCIFVVTMIGISVSMPANAASWGPVEKGACEGTTGKRIYSAKLKRNFGDDPAASLCPRLHKTVAGKSRVPDKCEKKGITGYEGIWLVPDDTCAKKSAAQKTSLPVRRKAS